jgi:hypothetical protein
MEFSSGAELFSRKFDIIAGNVSIFFTAHDGLTIAVRIGPRPR